ncbi:MAG TPA: methylenetetrahydrofolate reductase [NAD(P)H], partial [Spongiibacteraceae bacterium]|nr:methylenetetrahydrofolate reductase [NAD(P)H] [Spongiibacteraceae bacterium]
GIMPITNFSNLARFSRNCGAELPRWMTQKFESYEEGSEDAQQFGIEVVTRLCEQLLAAGAPGIHFYTMNGVEPVKSIWKNLKL